MKASTLKIILAAVIISVLLLIIAPKIIGSNIQRLTVDPLIALIPPEDYSQLEFHRNEFSSGWFSSSAVVELIYTPLGRDSISLLMDFDINHGPLLLTPDGPKLGLAFADINPSIRSNELFELALAELPFSPPEITLDLLLGFNQSLHLGMNVAALNYSGVDAEINFAGMDASFNANQDQSATFILDMGALDSVEKNANSNIVISGLSLRSHTAQMHDLLAESSTTLSIPSVSSSAPLAFTASEIVVEYGVLASSSSAENVDILQNISVADITGDLPIRSFNWNSEVKELNGELLRHLYQLLSDLEGEIDFSGAEINRQGQELLLLSLQHTVELNNVLTANAFEGDHSADLRIQWAGLADLNNIAELDMTAALAALAVELDVSLDLESILRSPFAEMVDPYVEQGYVTIDSGTLLIQASLQNSLLQVNGKELPLEQFFEPLSQANP